MSGTNLEEIHAILTDFRIETANSLGRVEERAAAALRELHIHREEDRERFDALGQAVAAVDKAQAIEGAKSGKKTGAKWGAGVGGLVAILAEVAKAFLVTGATK